MAPDSASRRPSVRGALGVALRLVFLLVAGNSLAGAAPAGSYTTIFLIPKAPDCIPAGQAGFKHDVCMASEVGRVSIIEESTAEILADCEFDGRDFVNAPAKAGESFSCERKRDAAKGSTEVRVYSKHANLPIVRVSHLIVRDGVTQGVWQESVAKATDGVVHAPDGKVYADPYAKPELKFAGHKQLFMVVKKGGPKCGMAVVRKLQAAGYNAIQRQFADGTAEIDVYDTFDGRVLIEDRILKKEKWKPRKDRASTRGNKGTYDLARYRFKGTDEVGNFTVVAEGESECGLYGEWGVTWNAVSVSPVAKTEMSLRETVQTSGAAGNQGELRGEGTVAQKMQYEDMNIDRKGKMSVKGTATIGGTDEKPTITLTFTEFNLDVTGSGSAGGEAFSDEAKFSGAGERVDRDYAIRRSEGGHATKRSSAFTSRPRTYDLELIK